MSAPTTAPPADQQVEVSLAEVAVLVRRICTARLGPTDGQDAAQEALLRVWLASRRPDFRPSNVFGYAATVARYEVLRAYGGRDRHRHTGLGDAAEHVVADPAPGPAELVEHAGDAAAAVARLLDLLSPRLRQVMAVSMATDWDTPATAAVLGLSPSGVRTGLVRAMAQLRAELGVRSPNPLASALSERDRARRPLHACPTPTRARGPRAAGQEVLDVRAA